MLRPTNCGSRPVYFPRVITTLLLLGGAATLAIAGPEPIPPGGTPLLPGNYLSALKLEPVTANATISQVAVTGQYFSQALRVQTKAQTPGNEDILLTVPTAKGFSLGDGVFVRVWARMIQTMESGGKGTMSLFLKQYTPATGQVSTPLFWREIFTFGMEWAWYDIAVDARYGAEAGRALFMIGLGGTKPQTIEIGAIELLTYGTRLRATQLPHPKQTYAGRESDAPWRARAAARIEQHRKGDLAIQVIDTNGAPVAGAQVKVKMTRHAFAFGTALSDWTFNPSAPDDKYLTTLKKWFNEGVPEGSMKWPTFEEYPQRGLELAKWMRNAGMTVRGHNLVWPKWSLAPWDVKALYDNTRKTSGEAAAKAALRKRIDDHIREVAGAFKGQVVDWDVTNETSYCRDLMNVLGNEEMIRWYRIAHETDPGAKLYANETGVLSGWNTAFMEKEVQFLLDGGAPLHGIGMQGHLKPDKSMFEMEAILERFSKFNLAIKVTEFDVWTADDALQGEFTRDFLTLFFSFPAAEGFIMWGFWDGRHWLLDAPLYYEDWTLKPSGKAIEDLMFKEWWTNVQGTTDARGRYALRGFLGEYDVEVVAGNRSKTVRTALAKGGGSLAVTLADGDVTGALAEKSAGDWRLSVHPAGLRIDWPMAGSHGIRVFDIHGRGVHSLGGRGPKEYLLPMENPGLYFVEVRGGGKTSLRKIAIGERGLGR